MVAVGFYQGPATSLYLAEEFHMNRIDVISSQVAGVPPSLRYHWSVARLELTVIQLLRKGKLNLRDLVTHVVPFEDAAAAFDMIDQHLEPALQVVLRFPWNPNRTGHGPLGEPE